MKVLYVGHESRLLVFESLLSHLSLVLIPLDLILKEVIFILVNVSFNPELLKLSHVLSNCPCSYLALQLIYILLFTMQIYLVKGSILKSSQVSELSPH